MDNERHAIETLKAAPSGYALAFNGEPIKKSCETCGYLGDEGDGYTSCPVCRWNDGNHNIDRLPTWPFKNGCKHFDLHFTYTVDWDAEVRRMDEEHAICERLSNGMCFSYHWQGCESAVPIDKYNRRCKKAPQEAA